MKNRRKKIAGVSALVLAFLLIAAGSGSSESTSKIGEVSSENSTSSVTDTASEAGNSQANQSGNAESSAEEKTEYHVGDILQSNNIKMVYTASGNYTTDNEFMQPDDGQKYIFIELYCENTSDSDTSISFYSFECYADGYACESKYFDDKQLSATLSAGRTTTGRLYFSVPENASDIQIEYSANFLTNDKVIFVFDGDKDSGFEQTDNRGASENAYKVGDIVKTNSVIITFLSSGEYKSDNMFIQPKDGYHFIYCEFEFENISSTDQGVTVYDFDCYADGANCEATYAIEDELSATISPSRKAKGKVAFEVPDNANNIEVEYVNNVWTSDRVIFTYK